MNERNKMVVAAEPVDVLRLSNAYVKEGWRWSRGACVHGRSPSPIELMAAIMEHRKSLEHRHGIRDCSMSGGIGFKRLLNGDMVFVMDKRLYAHYSQPPTPESTTKV